ncbi:MAG TPA: glucose-6-phosphate isomerase [Sulfurovum sp.]|jgi:glucose-6-phosphate isomerase|nr:MAG: glucose-6-phosphate isomerase [Sulfurovum sp. 35-42-20]OYY57299.1 MAG: glucose-6-phosphate isomerase [Sulfurovum sp. 28-43-6]OYZ24761.1 MAG: glucose-6-phosphate isomerase [Sulfurovum sp. 16-42-52]OYZ49487.1 MAG: glucose-6-phosphate isomerase [Sulfurovum sp. 24-42-9]OZA42886.1 MAG: glucose-6-phosphate isomerase [Sulfurovum sp. 17-42-90]OZA59625.1 MAG: glucose-6-phosphate isomerase [Sulfurovum sp. 39-42-12]HQR73682.1 glucose-6-phosphate isomerase [Sulfurovum sp.]
MTNKLYFTSNHTKEEQRAFAAIQKEQSVIGYYALPNQDIGAITSYCATLSTEITTIAVIGIGGSSLGAKAVYEFMKPVQELTRKLYFFESTDPINISDLISKLDLSTTHFLIISKSGTTTETISVYKYLYTLQSDPKVYTFITDPGSPLEKYAHSIKASVLHLPDSVGGRFSVLSSVGLVPLALCGIDIEALLLGAKKIKNSFFNDGYLKETLLKKAVYYAKNHAQYNINCIFAYSETLKYFCQWYVQLWGESLGKHQRHSAFHVGLTPIGLIGPKDQHSFLQLIMEGTRDKSVTFIKIEDFHEDIVIPDITLPHLEMLDTLNNLPFSKLINMQCDSVVEALLDQESIPLDTITLQSVTEDNIGALIFYYELLTSLVGELIDVNTYDQPGVEAGKIILKKKLQQR